MNLRPGDIVCERSPGWLGAAVRWFTQGRYEPPTRINHVAVVVKGGSPEEAEVIEALWRVVRRPLSMTRGEVEIWRLRGNTERTLLAAAYAMRYFGESYGWWKIVPHLIDALLIKITGREVYLFRRLLFLDRYPICSWVVAWAYYRAFRGSCTFGVPPSAATPDDIHDFVSNSPDWELVYARGALDA